MNAGERLVWLPDHYSDKRRIKHVDARGVTLCIYDYFWQRGGTIKLFPAKGLGPYCDIKMAGSVIDPRIVEG